jgi:hypothetical protein
MKKMFIVFVAMFMFGCTVPAALPEPDQATCSVTMLSVLHEKPICAVECSWARHYSGYATSTVVPCSWRGKEVSRK